MCLCNTRGDRDTNQRASQKIAFRDEKSALIIPAVTAKGLACTAKSPNYADLLPEFQDKWGPRISMQVIGIGYNPKKVKTPPTSWDDLWKPEYKGRVGLTALNSQLGIAFLAELNRVKGGTPDDFGPAFKALRELLPNVCAVAANLGAYATLWQQEQVDIAPYNFNFVQTLKGKDVSVELAIPATGPVGWHTSLHLVAGAAEPDLAVQYIDEHLTPQVQAARQMSLHSFRAGTVSRTVAPSRASRFHGWSFSTACMKASVTRTEWFAFWNGTD